jgi:hypothetical protein
MHQFFWGAHAGRAQPVPRNSNDKLRATRTRKVAARNFYRLASQRGDCASSTSFGVHQLATVHLAADHALLLELVVEQPAQILHGRVHDVLEMSPLARDLNGQGICIGIF